MKKDAKAIVRQIYTARNAHIEAENRGERPSQSVYDAQQEVLLVELKSIGYDFSDESMMPIIEEVLDEIGFIIPKAGQTHH